MNRLVNFLPPKEIYLILNEAEAKGIIIPEVVTLWLVCEEIRNKLLVRNSL